MPREKKPEPVIDESKRWLDSYADAVTLLMAFFVMLFAFSLTDEQKFEEFKYGMESALGEVNPSIEGGVGLLANGDGIAQLVSTPPALNQQPTGADDANASGQGEGAEAADGDGELEGVSEIATPEQAEALQERIEDALEQINADEFVQVTLTDRGIVLTFDEAVLFPSGQASINVDGQIVLGSVAQVLRPYGNQITVEGHTDTVPTRGTDWPTNWELGAARAVNVTRFMAELGGIPGAQMQAVTFGEFRPAGDNSTEEGRAANRRVEMVVLVEGLTSAPPDITDGLFGELDQAPVAPPVDDGASPVPQHSDRSADRS
ncbi:MAG: flagellar motor protein MotB [Acidimicrobiales bacterium]|nr:flagellar motor protein MotB [Acidimicrobiales bacterium]